MKLKPSQDTTYLYLVRHAATPANDEHPYILQGQGINKGLSDNGRQQAVALGRFLGEFDLHAIYSSPLLRAMETAEAVADHHRCNVEAVEQMHECNVGRWEAMSWERIAEQYPDEYRCFMENPADVPYLGGESYRQVLSRVQPLLAKLMERHRGESIAVVGHNVVNRAYLAPLLGIDLKQARGVRQSNTGINVIRYRDGEATLLTLNAVFHLERV